MKRLSQIVIILLLVGCTSSGISQMSEESASAASKSKFIWVKIIYRPFPKKNELIPSNTEGLRHAAIVSEILPHGIWEMGPDSKGMIATTNTVKNLSEWPTHIVTQKCIELGGYHIISRSVEVNEQGLLKAIKLYEETFAGKEEYIFRDRNENYAVNSVIYGAGGDVPIVREAPGYPSLP
jgi:hypothetical protein